MQLRMKDVRNSKRKRFIEHSRMVWRVGTDIANLTDDSVQFLAILSVLRIILLIDDS